ncbi:LacI family DNA-binding transcriptional regulator [Paracraurococcus lichenis]|uniref:LacI family DNA-binding transcriptional regulator n=1 Tax=Paracraurococcus lichenis TaxID=3064888 RepID=A0ABT9E402_9PROT|nr:LacI family DNA-binding transcriptional regulator [Paracraurococcus sp. LOR1-02]MDO9710893.1 LacI family DNA-binding transcriptional regulator [Paracraurococcus sp. LOR1-02]
MTASIKDVAKAAGVSPATVSRALGKGPVSEALRAQVLEAVRATGYRPNLAARRLRSQETGTVGLVVADIGNPFFTGVARAVEEAAYQAGLRVILCNTDEDPEREAIYLRLMQEERVTGLILAPTLVTAERLARQPLAMPVVLIDRPGPPGRYDSVLLDNAAASAALVDHLVAQGCRRIAGVFGRTSGTGVERAAGYRAAMARHGLDAREEFALPQVAAAEAALAALLAGPARPEAVIASNSLLLMGLLQAIRAAGLRIPEDLALAGFDNESWTGLVEPGLTVIEQPLQEIGRVAMSLLFDRLRTPEAPVRKVMLGGRCVVRGSTARRAMAALP